MGNWKWGSEPCPAKPGVPLGWTGGGTGIASSLWKATSAIAAGWNFPVVEEKRRAADAGRLRGAERCGFTAPSPAERGGEAAPGPAALSAPREPSVRSLSSAAERPQARKRPVRRTFSASERRAEGLSCLWEQRGSPWAAGSTEDFHAG